MTPVVQRQPLPPLPRNLRLPPETIRVAESNFDSPIRGQTIVKHIRVTVLSALTLIALLSAAPQQASKHILSSEELKKAVPAEYLFRGQKAPTQVRNPDRFELEDGK